jgi:hypothetical protein
MSKYEWERGTLKLPTAAWKPFRDGLAEAFNGHQVRRHALALKVHAYLTAEKAKAKRGSYVFREGYDNLGVTNPALLQELEKAEFPSKYALEGVLFTVGSNALISPKKKDFALVVATKQTSYSADEAGISLNSKTRQVEWGVPENNHAIDSAWDSLMGRAFHALLAKVEWTRGTGGEFTANDDYNQDNQEDGGGANYVTQRFGPKTATATKRSPAFRYR